MKDCKIVQDLLPNYIENLTDEETNKYIQEHISKCKECTEKLKNMNGELQLEKINEYKKIKSLKKSKRRKITLISILLIMILLIVIVFYTIVPRILFSVDENGNIDFIGSFKSFFEDRNNDYGVTCIEIEFDSEAVDNDGTIPSEEIVPYKVKYEMLFIFDKGGKCIAAKQIIDGYHEQTLQKQYQTITDMNGMIHKNPQIIDGKLYTDYVVLQGRSKEDIETILENSFSKAPTYIRIDR